MRWDQAQAQAVEWGGYLATVNDVHENTWLVQTFSGYGGDCFIGANDLHQEGVWVWVEDGTNFWNGTADGNPAGGRYSNWSGGEPNNSGNEDVGQLYISSGTWNDEGITSRLRGIVEASDTDGDGLPDRWETGHGLSPTDPTGDNGADGDPDSDGLTNAQEYAHGADPDNSDTDGDGLNDGDEVNIHLTNPARADSDGDGLSDSEELAQSTNPNNPDTDGDGLPDGWEVTNGLLPNDATGDNGASGDPDTDGVINSQEHAHNTDPQDLDTDDDTYSDDAEISAGSDPTDPASDPTNLPPHVTYRLGDATELLDEDFYSGADRNGSGLAPMGRMAFFGSTSNDGKRVAFWAVNIANKYIAVFLVDIGVSSSWLRLWQEDIEDDPNEPIIWTPDDQYIVTKGRRTSVATGATAPHAPFGYALSEPSSTRLSENNWFVTNYSSEIVALPVLPDGSEDSSRQPTIITAFSSSGASAVWPAIAPDWSAVTFLDYHELPVGPNTGDVYVLANLPEILNAPRDPLTGISTLAPTSLSDPHIVPIRTSESEHVCVPPFFSEDRSLVFYSEDWNNVFVVGDFYNTLLQSNFDVMVSRADGTGEDFQVDIPRNQAVVIPTPGGTRLIYIDDSEGVMHLYISTLEVASEVTGTTVGDNDIVTTTEQHASDASGTTVEIPAGTTVNFPADKPQEVQITTPIDPAQTPQLPEGIGAIPVIRQFGPEGTTFDQDITITISYTDAEIGDYDEATLQVFMYNEENGKFDIPVETIIGRDFVNNTISFTVTHFSTFGLAEPDTDGDGILDTEDPDDDNDGIPDASDAFPLDTDNDGLDNVDDPDNDADGIPDGEDAYPLDTNNNGLNNAADPDDDSDGIIDSLDEFPLDTNNNGLRNDVDPDDDGDGIPDIAEPPGDADGDGIANLLDLDSDNDGAPDGVEFSLGTNPYDPDNPTLMPLPWWPIGVALLGAGLLALRRRRQAGSSA